MNKPFRNFLTVPSLGALTVSFLVLGGPMAQAGGGGGVRQLPVNLPQPPQLNWQPCPDSPTRDCATLSVPLDYANLNKGLIDLPVVRAPATGNRIGTLIYNPGGPQLPAANFLKDPDLTWLFNAELLSRFDIVAFNARGTTAGITCIEPQALQELYWEANHLPRSYGEIAYLMGLESHINDNCHDNNLPLVKHTDSASTVRDMEQLRRAAGLQSFTFVGQSYGGFIGYRYASLYPGRMRAMLLDATTDRTISDQHHIEQSNLAYDQAWQDFKAWCHATASCQLQGEDIDAVLESLRAQARANPIPAPLKAASYSDRPVNDWILTFALQRVAGFGDIAFNWIDQVISEALAGDASLARYLYDDSTGGFGTDGDYSYVPDNSSRRSITCLDTIWSKTLDNIFKVKSFAEGLREDSVVFGESNAYQVTNCYDYPITPVETPPLPINIAASLPVLIVGATDDASTPLVWSQHVASQISGSRLLVREGYGHVSYWKSRCIQQHADDFLIDLTLPSLGTVCPTDPDLYPVQGPLDLGPPVE